VGVRLRVGVALGRSVNVGKKGVRLRVEVNAKGLKVGVSEMKGVAVEVDVTAPGSGAIITAITTGI
jgi:hypothetical protein